jgi:outer membrane protein assembly factor BamB
VTTDGKHVFAIFANGDVICFDFEGNRIWARNLGLPDDHYGHASSLITWGGKLFVQYDTNKGGKVLALNADDGSTTWETVRPTRISWASPVLADFGGKKQLILTADPIVVGYDTETGKELWKVDCMTGEIGSSVAIGSGLVFAGNENAKLVAIDPATATVKWENSDYLPEVASLACADGMLFVATSYGVFVCYDAVTGEELWEEDFGTGFYSSPMIAGNKVYALDLKGIMHILELSLTKKVVGEPSVEEDCVSTPAFADGKIFIRSKEHLFCFGK